MGIEVLKGRVVESIKETGDALLFTMEDGEKYLMYHEQDCCESVEIEEIHGDLFDLIGNPILTAEERCDDNPDETDSSGTWTFYELATIKGSVTIRWYGSSNGYYSESVSFDAFSEMDQYQKRYAKKLLKETK